VATAFLSSILNTPFQTEKGALHAREREGRGGRERETKRERERERRQRDEDLL